MSFHWPLVVWQLRQLRAITLVGLLIALPYVMSEHEPLRFDMLGPVPLFILVHSLLIVWRLGRTNHTSFGFLYTQGYSRDALWFNSMFASAAGVLIVWLPPALAVWLGLRSHYQDDLENYWFPLMAETERPFPWWCLLGYAVLLPLFHYAWIRGAQPWRGLLAGYILAIGVVLAAFSIWNGVRVPDMPVWTIFMMAGGFAGAALSLFVGSRRLHRTLEVLS